MKRTLFFAVFISLGMSMSVGCSTNVVEEYEFIRLDKANISFLGKDNSAVEIKVEASGDWSVESSASWLKIEEQTNNSVTINVDDNYSETERETSLVFALGGAREELRVNQLVCSGNYLYRYPNIFDLGAVMSPNGRYVGGIVPELVGDNTWIKHVVIIDLATDEWHYVASEYDSPEISLSAPYAITDQGLFFVMDASKIGFGSVGYDLEGNVVFPSKVPGFQQEGNVQAVSADGRTWVGYATDKRLGDGGLYYPVKWEDNVPVVLEMPEKNYRGYDFYMGGIMARGMSHDGRVIYGTSWDDKDMGMCYWKDGKFAWVGEDQRTMHEVELDTGTGSTVTETIVDGMTCGAELTNISPNGKWIAGTWREETAPGIGTEYPGFFDTENEKTYIFRDMPGCRGAHATDDGVGFIHGGFMSNTGTVVDIEAGVVLGTMKEWIQDNFGMVSGDGTIVYVTPDKQTLLSFVIEFNAVGPRTVYWYITPDIR